MWSTNQEYWVAVKCNLLHSFWEVLNCLAPFTSLSKLHEFGAEKPISWAKLAHFALAQTSIPGWYQYTVGIVSTHASTTCPGCTPCLGTTLLSTPLHSVPKKMKRQEELTPEVVRHLSAHYQHNDNLGNCCWQIHSFAWILAPQHYMCTYLLLLAVKMDSLVLFSLAAL